MNGYPVLVCLLTVLAACGVPSEDRLVSPDEVVLGRVRVDEAVWLLTDTKRLVRFSVPHRTSTAVSVSGLGRDDEDWGLASVGQGPLLTLLGPSTVVEVGMDGKVARRLALRQPHVGIYGVRGGLLVQPVNATSGSAALEWISSPGDVGRVVGTLRITRFGTRAETLARNLVGCGLSLTSELPCWFNQDPRVHRVGFGDEGSIVELGAVWGNATGRGDRPLDEAGPVIDAHIASDNGLWVLTRTSGRGERGENDEVARYAPDGTQTHRRELAGRVRCMLDVSGTNGIFLSREGYPIVVSVE